VIAALTALKNAIDGLNRRVGHVVSWLALFLVLVQFVIVVLRYVFGIGSIWLQESLLYSHGFLFTLAAGYTLLHDAHVRVDVFYREARPKTKAIVDLCGAVAFLLPVCIVIWWLGWPFVAASWAVLEGSPETSGIQGVYLLKTAILGFALLLGLQAVSMAIGAGLYLAGHGELPEADGVEPV